MFVSSVPEIESRPTDRSGASVATVFPTIPNRVVCKLLTIPDMLCTAFPDVCEIALFGTSCATVSCASISYSGSGPCVGDEPEFTDKASAMDRNDG